MTKRKNSAPVSPIARKSGGGEPIIVPAEAGDWVRLPKEGYTLRGLTRSFLGRLCLEGKIKSILLKGFGKGKGRGVRLVHLSSLDAFLASHLTDDPK